MAVIPGADTLGQNEAAPDLSPVKYNRLFGRPNVVGEAISDVGEKVSAAAQKQQDQESEFEYGTTKSNFLIGKANLLQSVMNDPDWKSAGERYQSGITQLRADSSQGLQNPKMQEKFSTEANTEAADGLLRVNEFMKGREKEDGIGTLDNTLVANRRAALEDPASSGAIIAATQSSIDGAVAKGWLTEPQGVKARLTWTQDYGKGYADSLSDTDAVKVLSASLPQRGADQSAPSVSSPHPFNVGNVKIPGGGFAAPSSPTDGVTLAANTLRTGYRGLTLEQIGAKWAPVSDHNNPAEWAANVSKGSGIAANAVPNLNDPKTLQSLVRGISLAEKSPADRANFNPGVIQQGVAASIAGKKPNLNEADAQASVDLIHDGGGAAEGNAQAPLSARTGTPIDFLDVPTRATMLREAQARLRSDNAAGVQAFVSGARDTISYLQSGGDPSKVSLSSADISAHVPGQEGVGLADEFDHAIDYNKAVTQIATSTPAQVQEILDGHEPTGPTDFRENAASFEALQKAASVRQAMLFGNATHLGDPAGYAVSAMKDVGAAFTAANAKPGPEQFDAYVKRLNGAYQTLGVPPELRSILPRGNAATKVSKITSGTPQEALGALAGMKTEAGKWWPAVYRDLARNGLPPSFQAVSIVAPGDQATMVAALQKDSDAKAKGAGSLTESMKGLRDTDGASVTENVDKAIDADGDMVNLRATFGVAGRQGVDMFSGVREAVKNTALYLYAKGGIGAADAAAKATQMVTGVFDFVQQPGHPPVRITKGAGDDFKEAGAHALDGLTDKDVQPYKQEADEQGHAIDVPKEQLSEHALRGAKSAFWVAIPGADGNGAVRAMDPQTGRPVILTGGKPLDIPFARFNFLATQSRKTASAAEDKNAALMAQEAQEK